MLFASLITMFLTCILAYPVARKYGRSAGWILALPLLISAALIVRVFLSVDSADRIENIRWIPTLDITFALRLDGLSLLFALLVLVIGAGVLIYSSRYLGREGEHGAFFLLMTTFAAAMLLLVLADNLIVMFVAWEATTLCSFFLIARSGAHAREPAIRTLLVTAAGGLALLSAVVVIAVGTGTTSLHGALAHSAWTDNGTFTVTVAVLLAVAAFTKSAQFPFQAWLPDSMVAITPVSAYLHAAAMVKAGIYLLLRFSPALAGEPVWSALLIGSGLLTAILGSAAALRRYDLKELLAYSTISQLGLLVTMIGVGTQTALTAAVVHTVAHALFKSALFMLVGVIDHQAGTRDMRDLAALRVRMPITVTALGAAAASMAGIPLFFGFISKELMLTAFIDAPGPAWVAFVVTAGGVLTSVMTFAYSGRIVLGAVRGKSIVGDAEREDKQTSTSPESTREVREATALFWSVPAIIAATGLFLGCYPQLLDPLATAAASSVTGTEVATHLTIWHGITPALLASLFVITAGTTTVLLRRRLERITKQLSIPISGLDIVDNMRAGVIRVGGSIGRLAGNRTPQLHLAIPIVCLTLVAALAVFRIDQVPAVVGNGSDPFDWVLVALVAAGVIAAVRAKTRISAIVVTGIVGYAMTLWFFVLGAADVALTQLLVEILTVTVMVLLLRRLPARFSVPPVSRRIGAAIIAVLGGLSAGLGVWILTGRRELSDAAVYYLTDGEETTGGANIVNTILVDFRAFDTLGELTVLGVTGVAIAALLSARSLAPTRSARLDVSTPLSDARENSVFVRQITRILGPIIVLTSLILLFRGHQEPGGGFIAALVGGAGFALLYLAAPSENEARVKWPFLVLIGSGILIGAGTGFLGYLQGSYLTPIHFDLFGMHLTTALIFDLGVYLAVIGIVLTAFNLLGRTYMASRVGGTAQEHGAHMSEQAPRSAGKHNPETHNDTADVGSATVDSEGEDLR